MKAPVIFAAAAFGFALLSPPALAQQGAPLAIKTSDLDLATEAGQAQLARRVDAAAREACGMEAVRSGTRLPSRAASKCYEEAKAAATRQVNQRVAGATASPRG